MGENQKSEIKLEVIEKNDILRVKATGMLVYQTIAVAKEQLPELGAMYLGCILDMEELLKIDSTGFGFVLNLIKKIPEGKKMGVVIKDDFILELFKITKIDKLVTIYRSVEDATTSMLPEE